MSVAGCGASDRLALFGNGEPQPEVPSGSGGTASTPSSSSGGATNVNPPPMSTGGSGGVPSVKGPDGSVPPPALGGAPPISTGGTGGVGSGGASNGGTGGGPPVPTTSLDAGMQACNFEGTWASIIRIPVTWPGEVLVLKAGQGDVVQWNITQRKKTGAGAFTESTANCGIFLPDLAGSVLANNQKFGIRFPNDMFDKRQLPPATYGSTIEMVGTQYSWHAGPVVLVSGLSLANAGTATWPNSLTPAQTPDQDHDGMLGVTVVAVDPMMDPTYNWPPVGLPTMLGQDYPRASRIGVAVRTVATLRGTTSDCDQMRAAVDIVDLGGTPSINSMVVACIKTTGEACNPGEAQFLNGQRPQFTPSGPGTLVGIRIPDGSGCPDVRSRLPQ